MTPIRAFLAFFLMLFCALNVSAAELLDRIVAVVEDQPILQSELDEATLATLTQLRNKGITPPPLDTLRKRVLEQLILEKIQLQRAKRRGIQITDDEVNAQLSQIAARNGMTLEQLQQALEAQRPGAFQKLRNDVRKQLMIDKLRQIEIIRRIQITQNDIDQLIRQQSGGAQQRYHLRHILIALSSAPTKDQVAAAKAKAEKLYQQLKNGADFAALAVRHSQGQHALQGGDLGWHSANELPDLFLSALRDMKPGDISPPLKSAGGFHLLKLEASEQAQVSEADRQQARQILRLRKANELLELWLRRLRDEAHVEIYLDDAETRQP